MKPLAGRRVVVTRPRERAGELVEALESAGAEVLLRPAIAVEPPDDPEPLRRAAAGLEAWDWLVFTSVYAVRALEGARPAEGAGSPESGRPRVACVGPATAAAARAAGWTPDLVADRSDAEGLTEALRRAGVGAGSRVLFPRASDARDVLPGRLREAGARVDEVVAYRKRAPAEPGGPGAGAADPGVGGRIGGGSIDAVTFTSPSTVRNFVRAVGAASLRGTRVVVIGPTTAAAAREAGLRVDAVAREPTVAGLVEGVVATFNEQG